MQLAIFCDQSRTSGYKGTYLNEKISSNQFLVNIPIYQTSQSTKVYAWATVCYEKGSSNIYSTDEIVVIDFINDELNYPIIVGKLYRKNEKENKDTITVQKKLNSITSYGESEFNSKGFKLFKIQDSNGINKVNVTEEVTGTEIINLLQTVKEQQEKINALSSKVEKLEEKFGVI